MSLNKITLVGRIGKDPQVHNRNNNSDVVTFSIQTLEYFTNANGEQQEISDWHRISVYIPTWIDYTKRYVKSGDKVMVTAEATTSTRSGANGQTFVKIGFNAKEITLLEKRNMAQSNHQQQPQHAQGNGYNNQHPQQVQQAQGNGYNNQQPRQAQSNHQPQQAQKAQSNHQPRQAQGNGYNNQQQSHPRGFPTQGSALDKDGYPKVLDTNCVV